MSKTSLRLIIKSGPFSAIYSKARGLKRRLKGEPLGGILPETVVPMGVEGLLKIQYALGTHARFHFSLGRAYQERKSDGDDLLAVNCLLKAIQMGYEGAERARLHLASIYLDLGRKADARSMCAELCEADFSGEELQVLSSIMSVAKELP